MAESFDTIAVPDPLRSHGAWIVLFASVGAGALAAAARSVELGLVVGTGFAGGFLATAAFVVGLQRKARQALTGAVLASACVTCALAFDADKRFLVLIGLAALIAFLATVASERLGFLSRTALALGLAALTLAAPAAALASGASTLRALALFVALWPFFCWRSWRVAESLRGLEKWDRVALRSQGLREAAYTALWSIGVAVAMRFA